MPKYTMDVIFMAFLVAGIFTLYAPRIEMWCRKHLDKRD